MANKTLAANPGLMKEWLSMTALPLSDGTLMANNGVHAGKGDQGLVGFSKIPRKSNLRVSSDTRTGPVKRDTSDVDAEMEAAPVQWKRATTFSGVDQDMACRREAQVNEDAAYLKGNWLCNTRSLRRRSLQAMGRLVVRSARK